MFTSGYLKGGNGKRQGSIPPSSLCYLKYFTMCMHYTYFSQILCKIKEPINLYKNMYVLE